MIDLGVLETQRLMHLTHYDVVKAAERLSGLRSRIHAGKEKIQKAAAAGHSVESARLKLASLEDELRALSLETEVPCEAYDWALHFTQSMTTLGLPEGSYLSIHIPGSVDVVVALDDPNEPPF